MRKITPHLWYAAGAKGAAEHYIGAFDNARIVSDTVIEDTPSGDTEHVRFQLSGQPFEAIGAGDFFSLNPSISLMVSCASAAEVDKKWSVLSQGGIALMPLDAYPFSPHFGWIQDRYGLSWQLMQVEGELPHTRIAPCLLFSGEVCGRAEEAMNFYAGVFPDSEFGPISRYAKGEADFPSAKIKYAALRLNGSDFVVMDNAFDATFGFNEAFSFIVYCEDQREIDRYWNALSAVPEAEQCGWLKDKFGVSWQIVPAALIDMMEHGDAEQRRRVTEAFLSMRKFDLVSLEQAFKG